MQMENIGFFLDGCYAYGLQKTDVFQTVDLYEGQNMPQVRKQKKHNWASEASPTLWCSIEISRDIIYIYKYVGMYVCRMSN